MGIKEKLAEIPRASADLRDKLSKKIYQHSQKTSDYDRDVADQIVGRDNVIYNAGKKVVRGARDLAIDHPGLTHAATGTVAAIGAGLAAKKYLNKKKK